MGKNGAGNLMVGQEIKLQANLTSGEDAESLPATVRNVKTDAHTLVAGLAFGGLDARALGTLECCIRTLQEAGVSRVHT